MGSVAESRAGLEHEGDAADSHEDAHEDEIVKAASTEEQSAVAHRDQRRLTIDWVLQLESLFVMRSLLCDLGQRRKLQRSGACDYSLSPRSTSSRILIAGLGTAPGPVERH